VNRGTAVLLAATAFPSACASASGGDPRAESSPPSWLRCRPDERGVVQAPLAVLPAEGRDRPTAGQMSETAAQAKRLYDREHFARARAILVRVARGETQDDDGNRQIAAYHAAICAYRLGRLETAVDEFGAISRDRWHVKFKETFLWLGKLLHHREVSLRALDLLPLYGADLGVPFANAQQHDLIALMKFSLARAWYRRGDTTRARRILAEVPAGTLANSLAKECLTIIR
jgi:hypothetical protein